MAAIQKLTLIGGSAGLVSATAGGVAIYLNSGESIKDHIEKEIGNNFKFISELSEAHESLKNRYHAAGDANQRPKKDNKVVTKDEIIPWCESTASTKFSKETEPVYLSFKAWCFVNGNTLSKQAKQDNKQNIEGENGSSKGWKEAWTSYNTNKSKEQLEITGNNIGTLSTARNENDGGPALYNWCNTNGNKKMYEIDAEDSYKKYARWCFKS